MANELKINIIVNDDGTATITKFADTAAADLKKVEGAAGGLSAGFAKTWAGMAAGAAGAIYAFDQIKGAIQAPIEAYMESEKALLKMGMAMKNQGDFSREALADLEDFAAQIQKTTAFEDDATLAVMGNLKSYGMSNEEVKKATKAALDLATAKANEGMTVEKASEILGKSYLGLTTGLKKLGIQVDENARGAQVFDSVMGQVNNRFGGSAQAELLTYAGQWKQLRNQWGDVQGFLGLVFLKTIEAVGFAMSMMGAGFWTVVRGLLTGLGWLTEKLQAFANFVGLEKTSNALGAITDGLKAGAKNAEEASAAAISNADANYKNMMSFDKVSSAIDKMGIAGKRTQAIDAEAAKERANAQKSLAELIRKNAAEVESIGKSEYEQNIARIEAEAENYLEKTKDKVAVSKWMEQEVEKAIGKRTEVETKAAEVSAKLAAETAERQIKEWEKASDEYADIIKNNADFAQTENERAINKIIGDEERWLGKLYTLYADNKITFKQLEDGKTAVVNYSTAARIEKETEAAKKIADLNYNLIKDIRGFETIAYEMRIKQIEAQTAVDIKNGADRQLAARKEADEKIKAYIDMGKSGNDFLAGISAGYLQLQRDAMTWGKAGYEIFSTFATNSKNTISTVLFDGMTGQLKSFGDYWESFWNSIKKKFADIAADLLTTWLINQAKMSLGMPVLSLGGATGGAVSLAGMTQQQAGAYQDAQKAAAAYGLYSAADGAMSLEASVAALGGGSAMMNAAATAATAEFGIGSSGVAVGTAESLGLISSQTWMATISTAMPYVAAALLLDSVTGGIITKSVTELVSGAAGAIGDAASAVWGGIQDAGSAVGDAVHEVGSWFGFANGGAFQNGNVIPFALGDIVSRPTFFPTAKGMGLMGEAGPEAIMPLKRGSDGKLGVSGGGGNTLIFNFPNAHTVDRTAINTLAEEIFPRLEYLRSKGH